MISHNYSFYRNLLDKSVINASRAMLNNDAHLAFLFKIVFILYTDCQSHPTWKNHSLHVSVKGGVGIHIHISVQVDTDNLITCHVLEHL